MSRFARAAFGVVLLARAGAAGAGAGFTLDTYGGSFPAQHREAAEHFATLVGVTRARVVLVHAIGDGRMGPADMESNKDLR